MAARAPRPRDALRTGAAATRATAQDKVTLRYALEVDPRHPYTRAAEMMSKRASELTNGRLDVQVFPSAQLGGSREMVEGMQVGTVEMAMPTAAVASRVVKELEVLDLPFLFRDFAHLHAYLDGPGGAEMRAAALKKGIRLLGFYTGGTRGVYARKPLRGMDDLKGLKVRTLEAPIVTATWRALGAIPTPIPFPEVYSALQSGVVDAGEGNIVTYRTSKLDEVAPHVLHIRYLITVVLVGIAESRWQSLPADLRGAARAGVPDSLVVRAPDQRGGGEPQPGRASGQGTDGGGARRPRVLTRRPSRPSTSSTARASGPRRSGRSRRSGDAGRPPAGRVGVGRPDGGDHRRGRLPGPDALRPPAPRRLAGGGRALPVRVGGASRRGARRRPRGPTSRWIS